MGGGGFIDRDDRPMGGRSGFSLDGLLTSGRLMNETIPRKQKYLSQKGERGSILFLGGERGKVTNYGKEKRGKSYGKGGNDCNEGRKKRESF